MVKQVYIFITFILLSFCISAQNPAVQNMLKDKFNSTTKSNNNATENENYNGEYLIPADYYDYNREVIDGKFTQDWTFILKGNSGNVLTRSYDVFSRDFTATSNRGKVISAGTDVLMVLPILSIGKLVVPFKGFMPHAINQAITRGFKTKDIVNIMQKGTSTLKKGRYETYQIHYMLNGNTVVVETTGRNAGKVISVFSNNPGTKNGLYRGFINK